MAANYSGLIEPLARHLWGDPNEQISKPDDLRFGNHGSKSLSLKKNTFYDHEAKEGGGVIQLVQYATGSILCLPRTCSSRVLVQLQHHEQAGAGFGPGALRAQGHPAGACAVVRSVAG